ncbi:MAG: MBL fold metallo-hydrolase [Gammaproteobacteria bacterium]
MTENRGLFTSDKAQAYLAHEPVMQVTPLSQRLWTVSDGTYRSLFIAADNGIIAFDTFGTPGKARAYANAIRDTVPEQPIHTIIYSHDHLDHSGFAADLAPDAEIIADELCAKVIKLRQAEGQLQPTRVLSGKEHNLAIDGVQLQLLNPGPTHGSGNVACYLAEEKLLFSSDTILPNARYGLLPDIHLANFVIFMRGFLQLDWETFVPGRYEVSDRAAFMRGCDYIEAMQIACQQAFVEFVPIWAMEPMQAYVTGKLREQFGDMDGFDEHIGLTAIRIVHHYLMGGWSLEDTPVAAALLADEITL